MRPDGRAQQLHRAKTAGGNNRHQKHVKHDRHDRRKAGGRRTHLNTAIPPPAQFDLSELSLAQSLSEDVFAEAGLLSGVSASARRLLLLLLLIAVADALQTACSGVSLAATRLGILSAPGAGTRIGRLSLAVAPRRRRGTARGIRASHGRLFLTRTRVVRSPPVPILSSVAGAARRRGDGTGIRSGGGGGLRLAARARGGRDGRAGVRCRGRMGDARGRPAVGGGSRLRVTGAPRRAARRSWGRGGLRYGGGRHLLLSLYCPRRGEGRAEGRGGREGRGKGGGEEGRRSGEEKAAEEGVGDGEGRRGRVGLEETEKIRRRKRVGGGTRRWGSLVCPYRMSSGRAVVQQPSRTSSLGGVEWRGADGIG